MAWSTVLIFAIVALGLIGLGWRVARQRAANRPPEWVTPLSPPDQLSTRPSPRERPNLAGGGCNLFFGLGWTAFSLMFVIIPIAIFITEWRTASLLDETGVTTEAVVIDHRINSDSDGDTYYVTYRYDVPLPQGDRTQYTNEESVDRKTYEAMPLESRVTIRYAANAPEVARLIGRSRTFEVVLLTCFMLFGGLFVLIGVWLVTSSWQGIKNSSALARRGVMTTAYLTDRWIEKDSDGEAMYCVAVRFAVPGGPDMHVAEYNRQAFDRYLEGDSVLVRYLPDRPELCWLETAD